MLLVQPQQIVRQTAAIQVQGCKVMECLVMALVQALRCQDSCCVWKPVHCTCRLTRPLVCRLKTRIVEGHVQSCFRSVLGTLNIRKMLSASAWDQSRENIMWTDSVLIAIKP